MNRPTRLDVVLHEYNRAKKQKEAIDRLRDILFAGAGVASGLYLHKKITGAKQTLLGKLLKK